MYIAFCLFIKFSSGLIDTGALTGLGGIVIPACCSAVNTGAGFGTAGAIGAEGGTAATGAIGAAGAMGATGAGGARGAGAIGAAGAAGGADPTPNRLLKAPKGLAIGAGATGAGGVPGTGACCPLFLRLNIGRSVVYLRKAGAIGAAGAAGGTLPESPARTALPARTAPANPVFSFLSNIYFSL